MTVLSHVEYAIRCFPHLSGRVFQILANYAPCPCCQSICLSGIAGIERAEPADLPLHTILVSNFGISSLQPL